jgi:hypothetical protein
VKGRKIVCAEPTTKLPAKFEALKQAIAEYVTVDEVKEIRDQSVAMETYARLAKDKELLAYAAEIR